MLFAPQEAQQDPQDALYNAPVKLEVFRGLTGASRVAPLLWWAGPWLWTFEGSSLSLAGVGGLNIRGWARPPFSPGMLQVLFRRLVGQ